MNEITTSACHGTNESTSYGKHRYERCPFERLFASSAPPDGFGGSAGYDAGNDHPFLLRMTGRILAGIPSRWILLACIGLLSLNLRGPIVALAPVVGLMQADLNFSPVMLGLLTSIPVLCFSFASPFASWAARRCGVEFAVTLTLLGVLAGVLLRSGGGAVLVVAGTVVIGVAVTVGNIAVPLLIRRDFSPSRQGAAMGVYTAALNIGSFLTSVVTAPIADLAGWRFALAAVAVLTVAAIVVWIVAAGPRTALLMSAEDGTDNKLPPVRGSWWITAGLTAGFGGQAFSYYGVTAWLPSYLHDELGMSAAGAGAASSIFQILAIVGALGVPFAARFMSPAAVTAILGVLWTAVPVGLLLAPHLWWLWSILGGIAQGGGINIIFVAVFRLARNQESAGRMSATVQGFGYSLAAVAPPLVGFVHDTSGSWSPALLVILVSVQTFLVCTLLSVRKVPKNR